MNRLTRFLILVSLIASLLAPTESLACSCSGSSPTPGAYNYSSHVFIATVIEVRRPPSRIIHGKDGSVGSYEGRGPTIVRLYVEESLKGTPGPEVHFEQGNDSCAYPFEVGEKYLVYAIEENGKLDTDKCKRTRPISMATSDLQYIRGLKRGVSQATLYGDVFRCIIDPDGKPGLQTPFEKLTVIAESEETRHQTESETWGEYELILPPGKYKVWVERNGEVVSKPDKTVELKKDDCERLMLSAEFDGLKLRNPR